MTQPSSDRGVLSQATIREFVHAAHDGSPGELPRAALLIARIEHRELDPLPYLNRLEAFGSVARERLELLRGAPIRERIAELTRYVFGDLRFSGNARTYDDPRNSFLNDVLDRRTGIPITLAVVFMEIARRARLPVDGINFPGHFLVRCRVQDDGGGRARPLIIDPFHQGAILSDAECRHLLRQHAGDETALDEHLLAIAGKREILVRMLVNLKRVYVKMRSFPQARAATDLLLALAPSALGELRDRGLLAYHLNDFSGALRDLESYLRLTSRQPAGGDEDTRAEIAQIWEHVKTLRRRVATLN